MNQDPPARPKKPPRLHTYEPPKETTLLLNNNNKINNNRDDIQGDKITVFVAILPGINWFIYSQSIFNTRAFKL